MGKAAEWDGSVSRPGMDWKLSKAGQGLCGLTRLTGLDPRLYVAANCGQTCQTKNHRDKLVLPEQVCCGQREDLPLVFLPPWQAVTLAVPQTERPSSSLWSRCPLGLSSRARAVPCLLCVRSACSSFVFCLKLQISVMAKLQTVAPC